MDTFFLLNMLKLKQAIDNKDIENIDNAILQLNNSNINDNDAIAYMKDYFINLRGDIKLIKKVIDELNGLKDKEALKLYVELSNSFSEITIVKIKEILNKNIEFEDKKTTVDFYSLIAQAIIFLDDPDCLKMTIDKLQNL